MICLLQFAHADLCNVFKIPTDAAQQFAPNFALPSEETIERILALTRLFGDGIEGLSHSLSVSVLEREEATYRRQLTKPLTAAVQ